ncbi:MAG: methyl-accepting chemotaxis protein [Candidatus Omnitrophica bacterium]|nr:methyl-accepting chemotaxis protein [Candidatus Omnitrophota bacterium]
MFMLALSMIVPTVFIGGCLYYLIFTLLAEHFVLPDVIARDLLPVISRINFLLVIGLPVFFLIMITWALVLSYRFVAPLERLEEDIRAIDEGDYSVRLKIDHDHDLAPIAYVINDLVDKLDSSRGAKP